MQRRDWWSSMAVPTEFNTPSGLSLALLTYQPKGADIDHEERAYQAVDAVFSDVSENERAYIYAGIVERLHEICKDIRHPTFDEVEKACREGLARWKETRFNG